MKTKRIFLVRHGQTDYNLKGIVQGSGVDTDLNDTGRAQAKAFFDKYKDLPFKKIYTSALKRTKQSLQGFIDLGIPFESLPEFNEISWGEKDGKIIVAHDDSDYLTMLAEWEKGNTDVCIPGGESPKQVQKRILKGLDLVLSRPEEDLILICMHGRAMRILLSTIFNYELACMNYFAHHNLCLYELQYTGSMYSLLKFNDLTHFEAVS
ncbi:MAG: histidine phosphatase family protein [Cytophagaceae bacterium]